MAWITTSKILYLCCKLRLIHIICPVVITSWHRGQLVYGTLQVMFISNESRSHTRSNTPPSLVYPDVEVIQTQISPEVQGNLLDAIEGVLHSFSVSDPCSMPWHMSPKLVAP